MKNMKNMLTIVVIAILAILSLVSAAYAENNTEDVQFIEANGRIVGIFLNSADRKSACDGKTTLLTKDTHKGTIKGTERYHGEPHAVVSWSTKTILSAKVLYRASDTELDSLMEGSVLCLRGLNADRSRNDDIGEAEYIFMALLDRDGRKVDTVDYVFSVNKNTFSITHIRVAENVVNYYLVVGDARKGEPKTTKKSQPQKDTDFTMQPVDPEVDTDPTTDPEWTISGDDDQEDPGTTTDWTISGEDSSEESSSGDDTDWTITAGSEESGSSTEEAWTIGGDESSHQDEDTDWTIGGGASSTDESTSSDTGWTIGGDDSSSEESTGADTDWTI